MILCIHHARLYSRHIFLTCYIQGRHQHLSPSIPSAPTHHFLLVSSLFALPRLGDSPTVDPLTRCLVLSAKNLDMRHASVNLSTSGIFSFVRCALMRRRSLTRSFCGTLPQVSSGFFAESLLPSLYDIAWFPLLECMLSQVH